MKKVKAVRRKALALVLAAALLFGAAPVQALAAETEPDLGSPVSGPPAEDTQAPDTPVIETDLSTDPVIYYQGMGYGSIVKPLSVSASAGDGGQLSYQWYSGESPDSVDKKLQYGTHEEYCPDVSEAGTTYYKVVVTNTLGEKTETAESAAAEIIVVPQPDSEEEKALEAESGKDVPADGYSYRTDDTASALKAVPPSDDDGDSVWKYTWIYSRTDSNGSMLPRPVEGKESFSEDPEFTPPTDSDAEFKYRCFLLLCGRDGRPVCDEDGKPLQNVKTKEVDVTVARTSAAAPKINKQPAGKRYAAGTKYLDNLSVEAESSDGGRLSYQWYVSRDGGKFSPVKGATDSTCTPATSSVKADDSYYCVVTNTVNSVSGESYSEHVQSDTVTVSFTEPSDAAWAGDGTESSPYLLSTANDLVLLRDRVNSGYDDYKGAFFKMTGDLALPQDWVPIGELRAGATDAGQGKDILPFSGTFDGGGHTLTVPEGGKPLFGYVRFAAVRNLNLYGKKINGSGLVNNYTVDYGPTGNYGDWTASAAYPDMPLTVTIDDVTLKAGSQTLQSGLIDGNASGADTVRILNSTVEKGVTIGYDGNQDTIGSFAGALNGTIENCVSSADVRGKNNVGGLVGIKGQSMGNCSVRDSAFHGTVSASGTYAGGIIGSGYPSAPNTPCVTIQNCYADGSVTGADDVGGLFGGEPSCRQCWANGIGYIQNNYFSGTVHASGAAETSRADSNPFSRIKRVFTVETESGDGGAHVGGIVGNMNSLDRYNVVSNNYYLDSCGAQAGIGSVGSVTKMPAQNAAASSRSAKAFAAQSAADENPRFGRSDDPTGADAGRLAAPATGEQFSDGSVLSRLNGGVNSSGTWVKGTGGRPMLDTGKTHMVSLTVTDYPKSCEGGSSLDDDSVSAVAAYSDRTTESVSGSRMRFSGFDSKTKSYQTVAAKYQNHASLFETRITSDAADPSGSPVTVSFRLIGATKSNGSVDLKNGDYKGSRYVTWIPTKSYTLPADSKVSDLLKKALGDAGITARGTDSDYVSAIYAPEVCGGYKLAASANGPRSGWMYAVNGSHSVESIKDQPLEDGDEVVFHYADDYSYEVEDWFSDSKHPRLGDGTYYSEWLTAEDAEPTAAPSDSEEEDSKNKAVPPQSTVTTAAAPDGGTVATVTARPDAAPEISGSQSSVSVTVPPEVDSVLSAATAEKPAKIRIDAPASILIGQIGSASVRTVALTVKVPAAAVDGTNAAVKLSVGADASILQAAKKARKDLVIRVTDKDTGKEAYSWRFSGADLADSPASVTDVDLALNVQPASSDPAAAAVTAANAPDRRAAGTLLRFAGGGVLPAPASVRVYVGSQPGCAPNSKVCFYRLNGALKTLEPMPAVECAVDADGYAEIAVSDRSDYVLLPRAATNPYPVKSDTTYPLAVKKGGTYTFAVTVGGGADPVFRVGNGSAFSSSEKRAGNKCYLTVKAAGTPAPGIATAVYCALPKQQPTVLCYLAISA